MEITIERDLLAQALTAVASVAGKGDVAPILAHTLIKADEDAIDLTGTDLKRWQCSRLPAEVDKAGAICLHTATLARAVKASPKGSTVLINAGATRAKVQCGRANYELPVLSADDFPQERIEEGDICEFEIDAADLARMLSSVKDAMSSDDTRIYLNGAYLDVSDNELIAVATNGHCMALFKMDIPHGAKSLSPGIIPANTVTDLLRWAGGKQGAFKIAMTARRISVTHENTTLSSGLIEGTFPDYARHVPPKKGAYFQFEIDAFAGALAQVSAIAGRDVWAIKLVAEGCHFIITCKDRQTGSAADATLSIDLVGDVQPIGVARSYLIDWLEIAKSRDHASGVIFQDGLGAPMRCVIEDDESFTYVIMPCSVPW